MLGRYPAATDYWEETTIQALETPLITLWEQQAQEQGHRLGIHLYASTARCRCLGSYTSVSLLWANLGDGAGGLAMEGILLNGSHTVAIRVL